MTVRTITVTLPEDVYTQLEARARSNARSMEDVVAQTLALGLPPSPERDLPSAIQTELHAMEHLSTKVLCTESAEV